MTVMTTPGDGGTPPSPLSEKGAHARRRTKRLRVVTVAINAPPKNTAESMQVGKVLKYLGRLHDVTLVTTREFGGWRPNDDTLTSTLTSLAKYVAVPVPEQRLVNAVLRRLSVPRVDDDFLFPSRALLARLRVGGRPDVLYSRAMPHSSSLMALALAEAWRVPWVLHMSDPWVGNALARHGSAASHLAAERRCIEHATVVTVTSPATHALYTERYPRLAAKFQVFPNLYDDDDVCEDAPRDGFPYVIAHTGRLYGSRGAEPLARAIQHLERHSPRVLDRLRFVFLGFADEACAAQLRSMAPHVDYRGHATKDVALEAQRQAHALLLLDPPTVAGEGVFLPSKLLDYFAARRPIVAVTSEGSTSRAVIRPSSGACFVHDDAAGLARHLVSLVETHESAPLRKANLPTPPPEFAAAKNVERLAELLERL